MAVKKSNRPNPEDELVTIELFKDSDKYKDDVFVAVNGEAVLIKRGEPVEVKRKFANVLAQSSYQDSKTADLIAAETEKYKEGVKNGSL